jgi:hypothetical protein
MAAGPKTPSLYARMQTHGTLTETPREVPDARFALPSTIHWMRALAILAADQNLDYAAGRTFYAKVQARSVCFGVGFGRRSAPGSPFPHQ